MRSAGTRLLFAKSKREFWRMSASIVAPSRPAEYSITQTIDSVSVKNVVRFRAPD